MKFPITNAGKNIAKHIPKPYEKSLKQNVNFTLLYYAFK